MLQLKDIHWLHEFKTKIVIYAIYKRPSSYLETHTHTDTHTHAHTANLWLAFNKHKHEKAEGFGAITAPDF